MKRRTLLALSFAIISSQLFSQEREDRTFLNWDQMRAIINETSGERAMHHVLELVPYPRVRPLSEYQGTFRETDVMVKFAKEYGYSNVEVESFPSQQRLWQPTQGELWMVEPELRKFYDIYDVAVSLAGNSESGETTAEVVDVGMGGRAEDFANKDVQGKIVLGSAGANALQRLGVFERGAVGVLSYNSLRPDSYPDEIPSQGVSANAPEGKKAGFGWSIAPRVAREISAMLARGQKVMLKSVIKAETFPGELEVVHATIPGDGSTDQAVAVSAHLYEGYIKQGANDDNSGCAMTLEMGRAYIRLIKEGKLPPPRRTIHFLWVPEISGTNAWLNKHEDVKKKLIADLNFDMEGLRLSTSASYWILHRTPDTFPSFLNDLCANVMEFVADLNRERIRYRANGYRYTLPVVSANGSMDPFYISIEKHYGSSDHVTYMQHGIPAVIFVTWPDMWYHSSQDTPDKLDPTQFKRAAVVGIGAMSILASAEDEMALKVAGECLARGTERMGDAQRKGLSYLADVAEAANLMQAYKEARNAVRHQSEVEKEVVRSASVLFTNPSDGRKKLASFDGLIDDRALALQKEIDAYYRLRAEQKGSKMARVETSAEEKKASGLVAERVASQTGGFGGGGGGQAAAAAARARLPEADQASLRKVPGHMTAELNILLTKKKSVLEIRHFLSGEFEPLPLNDLTEYLRVQEKLGTVKLTGN
ncbi:MAG: M28 family peptidase [Ignavibacteriales bacterium]|nr:M28 family peptidase [Ignavibacteriales bacterium]